MKKKDKYEVWFYDSFDREDCKIGEFDNLGEAKEEASKHGGVMGLCYVFFKGERLAKYGSY